MTKLKKQLFIDRHGPKPSSNTCQSPGPDLPHFSLPTTFTGVQFQIFNVHRNPQKVRKGSGRKGINYTLHRNKEIDSGDS
jgi:hypothetical protein